MKIKQYNIESDESEHIKLISFNQNPNIGLYVYATDDYCLVGHDVDERYIKILKDILKVPVHRVTIAGTSLLGVFLTGNDKCLLVPKICLNSELKELNKLGIKYEIIDSDLTALGNTIVCNKHGVYISEEFSPEAVVQITSALGFSEIHAKRGKIADVTTVGSCIAINDKGGLIHRDAELFEIGMLEKLFKIKIIEGTINMGSPYIRSGIISNNKGLLLGSLSGGPEATNADIALGFIDG